MKKHCLALCAFLLLLPGILWAQDETSEKKSPFAVSFSAKIKSRHVWNGWLSCNAWNFQPDLTLSYYGAFFNAWAYTALDHTLPNEIDLTLGYDFGSVALMYIDMFYPKEGPKKVAKELKTAGYMGLFRYKKEDMGDFHQQMAMVKFNGVESFPLQLMAGVFTFGDATPDEESGEIKERYSTLIDLGYSHTLRTGQKLSYNLSATPFKGSGFFADGFNVVNVRFGVSQPVKITDSFSLKLDGDLIVNPYRENLYFVLGIGF